MVLLALFCLELSEGGIQVPVAKLRQNTDFHCGHQTACSHASSEVANKPLLQSTLSQSSTEILNDLNFPVMGVKMHQCFDLKVTIQLLIF